MVSIERTGIATYDAHGEVFPPVRTMHQWEQQTYDELQYQLAYNIHLTVHSQIS